MACILWNFDEHFNLRKSRQLLCLVFIQSYPVYFVNKSYEIMDMKKCAAIPLNIYFKTSVSAIHCSIRIFFTEKKIKNKRERPKDVW